MANSVVCQHCSCRNNNANHNPGWCKALKIYVKTKDKRAAVCTQFHKRKNAQVNELESRVSV